MMRNLACIAKVYGDKYHVGFMDYRKSEKVFESYDLRLDYGKTTPSLFIFDDEKAYPAPLSTLSAPKIDKFIKGYREGECQFCPQRIQAPQSEVTLYLEYAKNEVSNSM